MDADHIPLRPTAMREHGRIASLGIAALSASAVDVNKAILAALSGLRSRSRRPAGAGREARTAASEVTIPVQHAHVEPQRGLRATTRVGYAVSPRRRCLESWIGAYGDDAGFLAGGVGRAL